MQWLSPLPTSLTLQSNGDCLGNGNGSDGYGDEGSGNGDGNNTCNGDGNEGWRVTKRAMARAARAMTMATKRAMATVAKAMAMVGEGNVDNGKSNGQQQRGGQGQG